MAIYLKNINLSKNQLQNATLHPTGTEPTTTSAGQVYFDTSTAPTKGLYVHDGTAWTPLRILAGVGLTLDNSTLTAPVYDIDFESTGLGTPVTTNTAADLFAMYDDSVSGHRAITFGNIESNLTIANMIGGGSVGTVTSVTAGAGMTQTGGTSPDPILNVISHAGTANTVGTVVVTADSVGVSLGTTNITAAPGNHSHLLAVGATDVDATATEVNLLDLSAQSVTSGKVLIGTGASTAAWSTIDSSDLTDSSTIVYNDQANTYTGTASKQTFKASTTGSASIRLLTGVDPSSPVQGDIWMQSDNLKYRDSSATRTLIYAGGAFHDGFSDALTNDHIDHDSITITLNQTSSETSVTGAGQKITGNVTFTVGIADNAVMPGTGGMIPVAGTTGQRVATTGNFRYNTTDDVIEWYTGSGWDRPDTGGGAPNQDAFAIVTGDTGTATADAESDTLSITAGTGLVTLGVAGAAAGLTINYDIPNIGAVTSVGDDVILLGDDTTSEGIAKTTITNFISDNGIALLASPALSGTPTAPTASAATDTTQIATTAFVNTAVTNATTSIDYKESSRVASTATVSVTYSATGGTSTRGRITAVTNSIDGITVVAGDRVLLKDQSAGAQNGIWEVLVAGTGANGEWERATDFDEDSEVTSGAYTFIEEGTANENSGWRLATVDPIVIGGSSGTVLDFQQVSGAGQITAGDGLSKDGNTLDVNPDTANSSIAIVSDEVRIDTSWIGQAALTTVGPLDTGSIASGFTAIADARLETIATANKVSGSAVQLSATSAIENSTGLRLKSSLAGNYLTMTSQVLDVDDSSTTAKGAIETATVAETEAATVTTQAVTPAGLATYTRAFTDTCNATATTTVTHGLGHRNVTVEVYRTGTPWDTVHCDVARTTVNTVDVTITPTPTAGLYTIVVTGAAVAAEAV